MTEQIAALFEIKEFLKKHKSDKGTVTLQHLIDTAKCLPEISEQTFFMLLKMKTIINCTDIITWDRLYSYMERSLKRLSELMVILWEYIDGESTYYVYSKKERSFKNTLIEESPRFTNCPKGSNFANTNNIAIELLINDDCVEAVTILNALTADYYTENYKSFLNRVLNGVLSLSNVTVDNSQSGGGARLNFKNQIYTRQINNDDMMVYHDF